MKELATSGADSAFIFAGLHFGGDVIALPFMPLVTPFPSRTLSQSPAQADGKWMLSRLP
jgi:hypothetical protein